MPPQPERKERRTSPLRTRRRRARVIAVFAALVLCAAIAYGVHALSYLSQFNVDRVIVEGTERVPPSLIVAYVDSVLHDGSYHFLSRTNIALYPRTAIEKGIVASFPRIQEARVSRSSFAAKTVSVVVAERSPFAQWCASLQDGDTEDAKCYAMDDTGFIFADATSSEASSFATPYVFFGGVTDAPIGKRFIPGHLSGVLALLNIFRERGEYIPTGVHVDGEQDFSVPFTAGFVLKASFGQSADILARDLELVLSSDALRGKVSELEYVDLRFGNRVYYKLIGEEQATE
ncbi:MAG: hypothetical protein WC050_03855 [Candidatus Paceibacterota bacterium]